MNTTDLTGSLSVLRRDGSVVAFDPSKITTAVAKALIYDANGQPYTSGVTALSAQQRDQSSRITDLVVEALLKRRGTATVHIEDIQDQVELALMRMGLHKEARGYVLYRESRKSERGASTPPAPSPVIVLFDGSKLQMQDLSDAIQAACAGIEGVQTAPILEQVRRDIYDGIRREEVDKALILAARALIERDPGYSQVTARLLARQLVSNILGPNTSPRDYQDSFASYIKTAVSAELLNPDMMQFDLKRLASAIKPERDQQFDYLGLQTLADRYFLHIERRIIELPQAFFMRVAMGLALQEVEREARAIEFYELLSSFDFMSSTPTLFNAGTRRSQLSSCYLTTVADDLDGIYEAIKENALLSKFAGGLGNDWTPVRSMGSWIKGTNGQSQGVVPFLKVVNDTAVAVNQGGKRKGAVCTYLETNWIPDLFMKRVMEGKDWTLFSPSDCPDLHDKFGMDFEIAYTRYEADADSGRLKLFKRMPALALWRKMLSMLFETGHPWITFKDPCNIRSPQQHMGVVHSSNLCTEITLNTSDSEIAVCNLGSVNLAQHMVRSAEGMQLDHAKLRKTVRTAMRMLDNVIDINYYSVAKARNSNLKHRPVGMGIMGFQDCLYMQGVSYASNTAVQFADTSMEAVCYYAYEASSDLAAERGRYPSYAGSLWSKGILPLDSVQMLAEQRGGYLDVDNSVTMDWSALREKIAKQGMRNSNCVAIAPTATIANIVGVEASIEPTYQNLFVTSNLSGEFTVINAHLVRDLKKRGLWDEVMVSDLKYFDGSVQRIDRVPADLRAVYLTAFEVEPKWLIEAGARRQKWIDQAQSLNIYMAGASGKKLDETYKLAWQRGLKTTYYLRTLSATSAEKSTGRGGELNAVSAQPMPEPEGAACMLRPGDPGFEECEACQ